MHYHLRMKPSPLASALLLLLCLSAQAQTALPDDGEVKNGEYSNLFFSFAFKYPKDWVVHDEAINERIRERAKEEAAKSGTRSQLKDVYLLFTVSRHPRGTPGIPVNPTILVIAEKIGSGPGSPTAKDYLLSLRPQQMKRGGQTLVNGDGPVEFRVHGFQFFRDDYSGEVQGVSTRKAIFVTVKKGYAVAFSCIGEDQKSVDEMAEAVKTILPLGRGGGIGIGSPPPAQVGQPSASENPKALRQMLANQPNFTAVQQDYFSSDRGSALSLVGKVAKMGNKHANVSENAIVINEPGSPTVRIFPKRHEYTESPAEKKADVIPEEFANPEQIAARTDAVFKSAGVEKIGKYTCVKIEVSFKDKKVGEVKVTFWLAQELKNLAIRTETSVSGTPDGGYKYQTEFQGISLAVDEEIFRVPAGYKKVTETERTKDPRR